MTAENQLRLAQRMLTRPSTSCSWDDMLNHEDDLIWHTQIGQPYLGELRCCVDSIGMTLAFLALPAAGWHQLEREFGAAAVAFRFMAVRSDLDAFIKASLASRPIRVYADGPVLPPTSPADPFEPVLRAIEVAVTHAAPSVDGNVRVRPLRNKNGALRLLVITGTIATRDHLHQLPSFRRALEQLRDQLLTQNIHLRDVSIEAQEVIDRIDHLITAEDILESGEAPRLHLDQGAWSALRRLWPFGLR